MPNELDPRTVALLEATAVAVVDKSPEGWRRATLHGSVTKGRASDRVRYERSGDPALTRSAGVTDDLLALAELTCDPASGMEIELVVDPSGRFEAVVARRRERSLGPNFDGQLFVLDPDYLPTEPGEGAEGPADATQAGDPGETVRLLQEYLRRRARIAGEQPRPNPPAGDAVIERVERRLGVALPDDLRALYRAADGGTGLFPGYDWWVPADELLDDSGWGPHFARRRWSDWGLDWNNTIFDAHPAGTVRRVTGHPGWIPFAHGEGGTDWLAVDMSPARSGRTGQVIRIGPHHSQGPGLLADSVTAVLRRCVDALDRGRYVVEDDDHLEFMGDEWDLLATHRTRSLTIDAERSPLDGVRPELQQLIVWNARTADLEFAVDAPLLRGVELRRCGVTDLSPLRDLPVETLRLELETADLAPLSGHPTLRNLTLATAGPVDLTPLRTLPRLHGLDLHDAAMPSGLETVAGLGGLRFLFMRHDQWKRLRERTDRLPPLAAAKLGREVTRGQVLKWAKELGGRTVTEEVLRHTGRVALSTWS